ncbi:MAG TPA: PAS domain S-box protein, partial [Acidobacteriota bacterium]|nr:PAS domain S-box protein [Acidobacteriota bacterium]
FDGMVASFEDITERKRNEYLLASELQVLEMISTNVSLPEILERLVLGIEAMSQDTIASVLLLDPDGLHVHYGAAPHLPDEYNRALEGSEIGPNAGSCGTAAYRREPVIVTDIEIDPLWDSYRELARTFGLQACWSTPIMNSKERVLGTFAMYYRQPRRPQDEDFKLIERATHIAKIAIERKRAEWALRESEERLVAIFKAAPGSMMLSSLPDGKTLEVNDNFSLITGYSREEAIGKTTGDLSMWSDPDARDRFLSILQSVGLVRDFEADLNHKSGTIRNGLVSGRIITVQGKKYLLGTFYDITARKTTEKALAESEERYRAIVSNIPGGLIHIFDRDMRYV